MESRDETDERRGPIRIRARSIERETRAPIE